MSKNNGSTQDTASLVEQCTQNAIELLRRNSTPQGILAATPSAEAEARHYTRIFGRDAAICVLGMVVTGDEELIESARQSLLTLAGHQAENGQIPKYVDPLGKEADFWYLGCIDATLWWLIAVCFFDRQCPERKLAKELSAAMEHALTWLHCQEHQRLFLLQQNEASDWADIMPRSGFVLYTNALWYFIKVLFDLPHREETHFHFNHLFYPFSRHTPDYRRLRLLTHYIRNKTSRSDLYLSFVNFSFWGEEGDIFGNLLGILLGLTDERPSHRILRALERSGATRPYPIRATVSPIIRDDILWRPYMGRHRQNIDYQYHNGGSWPFIGGFWVLALAAIGRSAQGQAELEKLAAANYVNNWAFQEWFHGQSGEPNGMHGQSWNAAMFLLSRHGLDSKVFDPANFKPHR
ncbi:MAG TPA: glycoside hydrolase 100 family protein [Gammaproteobacteria bacterium]